MDKNKGIVFQLYIQGSPYQIFFLCEKKYETPISLPNKFVTKVFCISNLRVKEVRID